MKLRIVIQFLCFSFLFSCSSTRENLKYDSYIINALEIHNDLINRLKALNHGDDQNEMLEIIKWIDSICLKDIKDSSNYDFDYLIEQEYKSRKLLDKTFYQLLIKQIILTLK